MKFLFQSRRFVAYFMSMVLFVICLLVTKYDPITLATALGGLSTIYVGFATWKPSPSAPVDKKEDVG